MEVEGGVLYIITILYVVSLHQDRLTEGEYLNRIKNTALRVLLFGGFLGCE